METFISRTGWSPFPKSTETKSMYSRKKKNLNPCSGKRKEGMGEQGRQLRDVEEKKKAEAKALREKSARGEKLREKQEIQNRISDLQEQIRAKREEQGSLRTTWMVNDRNRLNHLNQEIAAMEQKVQSLQQKLGEEK